ncbi:MAG: hypothetical protein N3I86_11280, partial [Verrucomicrobiae bacterium]|nr:hypothetical protein [Verrucomicrobiae bacterium]
MPEPVTTLAGIAISFGASTVAGLAANEAHRLYCRWRETATDPQTGLPRSNDLNRASRESLRGAVQVLILELAGRLDPQRSWLTRMVEQGRWTGWLARPLFPDSRTPQQQWLDTFRELVAGRGFDRFHDQLQFSDEQVRECFQRGDVCEALGPVLAEKLLEWTRANVKAGTEPETFKALVRDGWTVKAPGPKPPVPAGPETKGVEPRPTGQPRRITLAHAWCLFFREQLRSEPRVFNDFVAGSLKDLHTQLDQQGANVSAELRALRESVARLADRPPVFTQFEAWLTPQLGELKDLLTGVQDELDALARGQADIKQQQGEIL